MQTLPYPGMQGGSELARRAAGKTGEPSPLCELTYGDPRSGRATSPGRKVTLYQSSFSGVA